MGGGKDSQDGQDSQDKKDGLGGQGGGLKPAMEAQAKNYANRKLLFRSA